MANSVHTARWITQLNGQGWDIHIFPAEDAGFHPDLKELSIHEFLGYRPPGLDQSVKMINSWPFPRGSGLAKRIVKRFKPTWMDRARRLAQTIHDLHPDVVHSLEFQRAGYLTLTARNHYGTTFPTWAVANWGSDIYLFGRLAEHAEKVKAVLAACDYYNCECQRDVKLARSYGFKGECLPVMPNAGGFNVERMRQYCQPGPTSARRLIVLKGYQNWAGRALNGLRAIELCADALQAYHVAVYLAGPEVAMAAELVSHSTNIPIEIISHCSHKDMLRLHGQARLSIGLSISDAISTSALEALTMGSFPIQSNTSCLDEWVQHGRNGLLVHPEDPEDIAMAIRRAVSDDEMVDGAAVINAQLAVERLDQSVIQPKVVAMYKKIAAQAGSNN